MDIDNLRLRFESLYDSYNKIEYLNPDPLYFVIKQAPENREVWAFVASMVSLGRVESILNFLHRLRASLGEDFATSKILSSKTIEHRLEGFQYRFYNSTAILSLILSLREHIQEYGTLENAVLAQASENHTDIFKFKKVQIQLCKAPWPQLSLESANKRYAMFLRWMVRKDEVDLGLWTSWDKRKLVYPLDTHVMRHAKNLGITSRSNPDWKAVCEVTEFFASISPEDPVKYDFVLSRLGIHPVLRSIDLYKKKW